MSKIFISYRRGDSQWQSRAICDYLTEELGLGPDEIFYDLDSMTLGLNFRKQIQGTVAQCDILLAVIGPTWLTATDDETGARRLDNPNDFVRLEIAAALERDIPVIPVFIDGAIPPESTDLPDVLRDLAERQGVVVRGASFQADMHALIEGMRFHLGTPIVVKSKVASDPTKAPGQSGGFGKLAVRIAAGIGLVFFVLLLIGLFAGGQGNDTSLVVSNPTQSGVSPRQSDRLNAPQTDDEFDTQEVLPPPRAQSQPTFESAFERPSEAPIRVEIENADTIMNDLNSKMFGSILLVAARPQVVTFEAEQTVELFGNRGQCDFTYSYDVQSKDITFDQVRSQLDSPPSTNCPPGKGQLLIPDGYFSVIGTKGDFSWSRVETYSDGRKLAYGDSEVTNNQTGEPLGHALVQIEILQDPVRVGFFELVSDGPIPQAGVDPSFLFNIRLRVDYGLDDANGINYGHAVRARSELSLAEPAALAGSISSITSQRFVRTSLQ